MKVYRSNVVGGPTWVNKDSINYENVLCINVNDKNVLFDWHTSADDLRIDTKQLARKINTILSNYDIKHRLVSDDDVGSAWFNVRVDDIDKAIEVLLPMYQEYLRRSVTNDQRERLGLYGPIEWVEA